MYRKIIAAVAVTAAIGVTVVAAPAVAQQSTTNSPITCPFNDAEMEQWMADHGFSGDTYGEMQQWMADHEELRTEMYDEMRGHMGDAGSMMHGGSMMGYGSYGD